MTKDREPQTSAIEPMTTAMIRETQIDFVSNPSGVLDSSPRTIYESALTVALRRAKGTNIYGYFQMTHDIPEQAAVSPAFVHQITSRSSFDRTRMEDQLQLWSLIIEKAIKDGSPVYERLENDRKSNFSG